MAAAIVDLDINEGETFIMTVEFWEDQDNTLPIDVSNDIFTGAFRIGTKYIPMTIVVDTLTTNVIEATVDYQTMVDLSTKGKYDIEQLIGGTEKYRLMQGNVRISKEVTN